MDVQVTADEQLVVMHDATMNRTTDATGNVSDLVAAGFVQADIDTSAYGPEWTGAVLHPPTLADVLREFGDRVYLSIDAKDGDVAALMVGVLDQWVRRKRNVIVVGGDVATVQPLIDAGYPVGVRDTSTSGATLASQGVPRSARRRKPMTRRGSTTCTRRGSGSAPTA